MVRRQVRKERTINIFNSARRVHSFQLEKHSFQLCFFFQRRSSKYQKYNRFLTRHSGDRPILKRTLAAEIDGGTFLKIRQAENY